MDIVYLREQISLREEKLLESKAAQQALSVGEKVRDKVLAAAVEVQKLPVLMKRIRDAYKKSGNTAAAEGVVEMEARCKEILKRITVDARALEKIASDMRDMESEYRNARMKY